MSKPAVIIVGADKGGVGKTTVSRTLLDYFSARRVPARAFDTEMPKGTLKRFHPDVTTIVDLNEVPDQMKIFDTLNETQITVIDVRAGLLSPTLRALRDIGFIEAARKNQVTFAVFHILGPTIASLDEIAETASFLTDAKYFLVKNFINACTRSSTEGWVANKSANSSRGLSTHISMTAEVASFNSPRPSILCSAEIMASGFLVSSTDPASARNSRERDSAS